MRRSKNGTIFNSIITVARRALKARETDMDVIRHRGRVLHYIRVSVRTYVVYP